MTGFPAEMDLLRVSLRLHVSGGEARKDLAPLLSRVNWHHVLWLGRQHRALLALDEALQPPDLARLCPPAIPAQLHAFREVSQLRSLAHARELCHVQDLFDRHAVRAILLDPWLAAHHPGGRPELIECGIHLHCLVPAGDLARAGAILAEAGHPLESDPGKLIKTGGSPVKLETGMGHPDATARLWQKSSTFTLGGRTLRRLAVEHWLLWRIPHRFPPENIPLGRAAEIVSLARQVASGTWPDVLAEAAHFDRADEFVADLVACHRCLGLSAPPGLPKTEMTAMAAVSVPASEGSPAEPGIAAPFLPTPPLVVERMLELAGTGPGDLVCDLGCGDGRFVIQAAKKFGAHGVGIDLDSVRIAEAVAHAGVAGVGGRATFIEGDVFDADLSNATVLCLYLLPIFYPRIQERLLPRARPGLRIVSHNYIFPGWPPEKTEIIRVGPTKISQIFLWRIG